MIRTMIVDDHPAMRAGLETVLEAEPDIVPVGTASGAYDGQPLFEETRPDVVMLDFHLPGQSSLRLVRFLKGRPMPPRVIIYSAHARPAVALGAALAGADAMVSKEADARELLYSIRSVADGARILPAPHELTAAAADHLPEEQLPLAAMLIHGTSLDDAAAAQGLDPKTASRQLDRMLEALEPQGVSVG